VSLRNRTTPSPGARSGGGEEAQDLADSLRRARVNPLQHPALWPLLEGANPEHPSDPESPVRVFSETFGLDAEPRKPSKGRHAPGLQARRR
jgi:hypothetical protein